MVVFIALVCVPQQPKNYNLTTTNQKAEAAYTK